MPHQFNLFDQPDDTLPPGFRYQADLISAPDERKLIARIEQLPFREFEFHGFVAKRRTVSFGWRYDFNHARLERIADIPDFLLPLRDAAAQFAGQDGATFEHALVTEYSPGAAIGWHKDRPAFADIVGVSLKSPCVFRLRRQAGSGWQRANAALAPRSAYLLQGAVRTEWEHSIPAVETLRYSVTFRSMRNH